MHIKMHLRTSKLAKTKFRGCIHVPRFNRGGSEKGERAGVERRRGEGKEKVEGMMEGRGGRKAWGIRMGGIAPLLLGGIDASDNIGCNSQRPSQPASQPATLP